MKIQGKHYITSSGEKLLLSEMPFPHLVNAFKKALISRDVEVIRALEEEIRQRPKPNGQ